MQVIDPDKNTPYTEDPVTVSISLYRMFDNPPFLLSLSALHRGTLRNKNRVLNGTFC